MVAKIGFDTAENETRKVWLRQIDVIPAARSARYAMLAAGTRRFQTSRALGSIQRSSSSLLSYPAARCNFFSRIRCSASVPSSFEDLFARDRTEIGEETTYGLLLTFFVCFVFFCVPGVGAA